MQTKNKILYDIIKETNKLEPRIEESHSVINDNVIRLYSVPTKFNQVQVSSTISHMMSSIEVVFVWLASWLLLVELFKL